MNEASPESESAAPTGAARRFVPWLLLGVAALVYGTDQLSKNWVVDNLVEGRTVPVLGEFLQWHFVRNPGAAFSLASGATWIFTILATVVVGVIVWQIRRLGSMPWAIFLGLLLGGVLGNLTDRLTREPGFPEGHVIDFILTPWIWLGFTPAIYNVADIGIVTGMGLFIIITVLALPMDGSPRPKRGAGNDVADADGSDDADLDGALATDGGTGTATDSDDDAAAAHDGDAR